MATSSSTLKSMCGRDPHTWDEFWEVMGYPLETAALNRQNDGNESDADWDGDGSSNFEELLLGTDPRKLENSQPQPESESGENEELSLENSDNSQNQPPDGGTNPLSQLVPVPDYGPWTVISSEEHREMTPITINETIFGEWKAVITTPEIDSDHVYFRLRILERLVITGDSVKVTSFTESKEKSLSTGDIRTSRTNEKTETIFIPSGSYYETTVEINYWFDFGDGNSEAGSNGGADPSINDD